MAESHGFKIASGLLHFGRYKHYYWGMMNENRKNWTDLEDMGILSLVRRFGTKNWAEISEKMSSKYGIDTRTGKQCRERWHNHLDPTINKHSWSASEEKRMFEAHQQHGNKWTEIAKLFLGRTDNDIKNHFYSMLRRSLRRINKMLGRRNSTQNIKVIKPSVLSKIFINIGVKNQRKSQECKKISEALFEFSSSKPNQDLTVSMDFEERHRLEDLIEKLASYNEEYEMIQLQKRQSKRSQSSRSEPRMQEVPASAAHTTPLSAKSVKAKPIRHLLRKRTSARKQATGNERQPEARTRRHSLTRLKMSEEGAVEAVNMINQEAGQGDEERQQHGGYMTRLKIRESSGSFGDDFGLPDLINFPQLRSSSSQDGSMRFKGNSPAFGTGSNASMSNMFSGPSPRAQLRNWSPLCPSPNISDMFSRGGNYEWKTNNEELDNLVNDLRRKIKQNATHAD